MASELKTGAVGADRLTERQIVEAAVALTRRIGFGRITMRGLADELGVKAASLYYYVKGKDELARLVADAVLDTVALPGPGEGDWIERLRRYNLEVSEALLAHPGVAPLLVRGQPTAAQIRGVDAALEVLVEAAFSPREALQYLGALSYLCLGYALTEDEHVQGGHGDLRARLAAGRRDIPTAFRNVSGELGTTDRLDSYVVALDALLAGIAARRPNPR